MIVDINDLRSLATLMMSLSFIGVCCWAYSAKRQRDFDKAAQLPFAEDDDWQHSETD